MGGVVSAAEGRDALGISVTTGKVAKGANPQRTMPYERCIGCCTAANLYQT